MNNQYTKVLNFLKLSLLILFLPSVVWIVIEENILYYFISLAMVFLFNNIGMDASSHRYFSHRSFEVNKFWHTVLALLSTLTTVSTIQNQVGAHRMHHAYEDTEHDPQNYQYVKWWKLYLNFFEIKDLGKFREFLRFTKDLKKDKIALFFDNNYLKIIFCYVFLLLLIDPVLVVLMYIIPVGFVLHTLGMANITTHQFGYASYEKGGFSKNNIWLAFITLGTNSWHNNHHAKPFMWKHGEKWWQIDPSSWFISLIKK